MPLLLAQSGTWVNKFTLLLVFDLLQYCVPCNLLAILANKGELYVLNLSNNEIVKSMNYGYLSEVIRQFVENDNAIAKELLAKIQEIHNRGSGISLLCYRPI